MERLTKRSEFYPEIAWPNDKTMLNHMNCLDFANENCESLCDMGCPIGKCFSKLADYEDAEEHGQLIKLPVPIGAKLYEAYYCEDYGIIEWTIRGYEIDGAKMYFRADDGTSIDVSEMGDEFFETREQAEAKLVEWEKEWEKQNGTIDKA